MVLLGPSCPRAMLDYKILATEGRGVEIEISKIEEILPLVAPHVRKHDQIRSLTRISMPRGAAVVNSNFK